MPSPARAFGSFIQATMKMRMQEQEIANVIHLSTLDEFLSDPTHTLDMEVVLPEIGAVLESVWLELVPDEVTLEQINLLYINSYVCAGVAYDVHFTGTLFLPFPVNEPGERTGSGLSSLMPSFVAAGINTTPTLTNKYTRGKLRIPGVYEDEVVDNTVSTTYTASLVSDLNDLLPGIQVDSEGDDDSLWRWCVWSRALGWGAGLNIPNPGNTNCFAITTISPRVQISSQLSRKVGKGN